MSWREILLERYRPHVEYVDTNTRYSSACPVYQKGGTFLYRVWDNSTGKVKILKAVPVRSAKPLVAPSEFFLQYYLSQEGKEASSSLVQMEMSFVGPDPVQFFQDTPLEEHPSCKPIDVSRIFYNYLYGQFELCQDNLVRDFASRWISWESWLAYVFQILVGFHFLETLGILHRDVKPQNLVVCAMEVPYDVVLYVYGDTVWSWEGALVEYQYIKIIDFGEAVWVSEDPSCENFRADLIHLCMFLLSFLWKRVMDSDRTEEHHTIYQGLCDHINRCREKSLIDVLLAEPSFGPFREPVSGPSILVKMIYL